MAGAGLAGSVLGRAIDLDEVRLCKSLTSTSPGGFGRSARSRRTLPSESNARSINASRGARGLLATLERGRRSSFFARAPQSHFSAPSTPPACADGMPTREPNHSSAEEIRVGNGVLSIK